MNRDIYAACPLCDSERFATLAEADCRRHALYRAPLPPTIHWMVCADCGHVFAEGPFDAEAEALLFSHAHAFQTVGHDYERQRTVWSRVVEIAEQLVGLGGGWLDVGFGDGALLLTAKELGFAPFGLDLRAAQVEALAALGVPAKCARIEAFAPGRRFDVVSLMDVLEHMADPRAALKRAAALTAPGGVLILSCPSYGSPAWEALQRTGNPYWSEIEHLHNFSRAALAKMLAAEGFRIRRARVSERYRAGVELYAQRGFG